MEINLYLHNKQNHFFLLILIVILHKKMDSNILNIDSPCQ